jgi:hypothetical protein
MTTNKEKLEQLCRENDWPMFCDSAWDMLSQANLHVVSVVVGDYEEGLDAVGYGDDTAAIIEGLCGKLLGCITQRKDPC